jgi:AcrR family transcriptional regulator
MGMPLSSSVPPALMSDLPRDTRAAILSTALTAFASDGFGSVTTRRIAREAGVNSAMIQYHFGSKDGLYRAVVAEVYERLNRRSTAFVESLPTRTANPEVLWDPDGAISTNWVLDSLTAMYMEVRKERDGLRILLREILDTGAFRTETRDEHQLPYLERMVPVAAELLRLPEEAARGMLVTMSLLIGRFIVQDIETLRRSFGAETEDEVHANVIACLATAALGFLTANHPPPSSHDFDP